MFLRAFLNFEFLIKACCRDETFISLQSQKSRCWRCQRCAICLWESFRYCFIGIFLFFFLLSFSCIPSFIQVRVCSLISVWLHDFGCPGSLPGSISVLYSPQDFQLGGCIRIMSADDSMSGPRDYLGDQKVPTILSGFLPPALLRPKIRHRPPVKTITFCLFIYLFLHLFIYLFSSILHCHAFLLPPHSYSYYHIHSNTSMHLAPSES